MDPKDKKDWEECKDWMSKHKNHTSGSGCGNAVYGLGLVGVAIYYFQHSVVFMDYVYALLKAIAWPAFLIYKVYTILGM
jgi:hypothetical protein